MGWSKATAQFSQVTERSTKASGSTTSATASVSLSQATEISTLGSSRKISQTATVRWSLSRWAMSMRASGRTAGPQARECSCRTKVRPSTRANSTTAYSMVSVKWLATAESISASSNKENLKVLASLRTWMPIQDTLACSRRVRDMAKGSIWTRRTVSCSLATGVVTRGWGQESKWTSYIIRQSMESGWQTSLSSWKSLNP